MRGHTKLSDTPNVKLGRELTLGAFKDQAQYIEVPAIGDGNCALNSFALCIIDLIQQGKLNLDNDKFLIFREKMNESLGLLRQRSAAFRAGPNYSDLAPALDKVIEHLESNPQITQEQFYHWVQDHRSREEIAAIMIAFAPALREIGVDCYESNLAEIRVRDNEVIVDAAKLRRNGVESGREILDPLARYFFEMNLTIYDEVKNFQKVNPTDRIEKAETPEIFLLHTPGHWNTLIQKDEKAAGLSANLGGTAKPASEAESTAELVVRNENLLFWATEYTDKLQDKNRIVTPDDITEIAQLMSKISKNLLTLGEEMVNEKSKIDESVFQDTAKSTEEILKNVRLKLEINPKTVGIKEETGTNEKLSHLSPLEKELLAGTTPVDVSTLDPDEAFAHALQNAEILQFVNENYDRFVPPAAPKEEENSRPRMR